VAKAIAWRRPSAEKTSSAINSIALLIRDHGIGNNAHSNHAINAVANTVGLLIWTVGIVRGLMG